MTETIQQEATGNLIGQPVKRVEDPRLITGAAQLPRRPELPGMTHAAILRSPYAHARIRAIDTSRPPPRRASSACTPARTSSTCTPLPCAWQAGGVENLVNTPRALEIDRVTFTGAGVAVVVAETASRREDALALIEVDWEPLRRRRRRRGRASRTARRRSTRTRPATSSWTGRCGDAEAADAGARRGRRRRPPAASSTSG